MKRKLVQSNYPVVETEHQEFSEQQALSFALKGSMNAEENNSPSPFHVWDGQVWLLRSEHEKNMLDAMRDNISGNDYDNQLIVVNDRIVVEKEMASEWETLNATN